MAVECRLPPPLHEIQDDEDADCDAADIGHINAGAINHICVEIKREWRKDVHAQKPGASEALDS